MQYASSYAATPISSGPEVLIVTDPDSDSIWFAQTDGWLNQIQLDVGQEPADIQIGYRVTGVSSELAEVAYVSLHGGGAVLSIPVVGAVQSDTDNVTVSVPYNRIRTCAQPRGLSAFPQADGHSFVYVACSDGALVTIDAATDTIVSTLPLADDLKDVVVVDSSTALVTQFRSASVFQVNLVTGASVSATLPGTLQATADVAWQMVPITGGALIVHQLASIEPIRIAVDGGFGSAAGGSGPEGECACGCDDGTCATNAAGECDDGTPCVDCSEQTGYGPSPAGCPQPQAEIPCRVGVVAAVATIVEPSSMDGSPPLMTPVAVFPDMVPPLTVAVTSTTTSNQMAEVLALGNGAMGGVDVTDFLGSNNVQFECVPSAPIVSTVSTISNPVALAFSPTFTTSPFTPVTTGTDAAIFFRQDGVTPGQIQDPNAVWPDFPLQMYDGEAGRDLFHNATPSLMSCASCHPNGRDDGHVWSLDPIGLRRTPALGGGLLATAPFHWDGAEASIGQLMSDVFVGRMDALPPAPDQVEDISSWLNGLPVSFDHATPDAAAVARGQTLFESATVGCATCHSGAHFTNNLTMDVGTGGAFQVPSLLGVGSRPPYLHDGRALDLADRFGPTGGGDRHGHTSSLTSDQIDDLVAYLRSL
jgi:mono/diheme cytochrome c family protein